MLMRAQGRGLSFGELRTLAICVPNCRWLSSWGNPSADKLLKPPGADMGCAARRHVVNRSRWRLPCRFALRTLH